VNNTNVSEQAKKLCHIANLYDIDGVPSILLFSVVSFLFLIELCLASWPCWG
jgi:hypothetical protein